MDTAKLNLESYLGQIDKNAEKYPGLLKSWAEINSHSRNLDGLETMLKALKTEFSKLGEIGKAGDFEIKELKLHPEESINCKGESEKNELGKALLIRKRPDAHLRVFLGGHMDTVFPKDHHFQSCEEVDGNTLKGPGVSDLKGGLIVMLEALKAFENFAAENEIGEELGWEVLINPDEEISSPGSAYLFPEIAKRNHLGLIYEPSLRDGSIVTRRFGAGYFTVVFRGRAAHVGREFELGRNALLAASIFTEEINKINTPLSTIVENKSSASKTGDSNNPDHNDGTPHIVCNIGKLEGGGPLNVVPDLAVARFNVRIKTGSDEEKFMKHLETSKHETLARLKSLGHEGIEIELHGGFSRKPKELDHNCTKLLGYIKEAALEIGAPFKTRSTAGCCDGNNLMEHGLPNIDTLGVRGANIHSDEEYVLLDSIAERAKLSALLLMKLATGEFSWEARN